MSTQIIPDSEDYSDIYDEAELEEQRLAMLYGTNPTDAARKHGIAEDIEVIPKKGKDKGKTVKIRVQNVLRALPKFLEKEYGRRDPYLTHLNHIADNLAEKFKDWLLEGNYSERSEAIDTPEKLAWLAIICAMVVSDYILECKHRGYALYNKKTFANKDVAKTITRLKIASSMTQLAAEGTNHVIKVRDAKGDTDEAIKKLRSDIIGDTDIKVKNVLSDNPSPFLEQYRKEQNRLQGDTPLLLIEQQAVNE